MFTRLTAGLSEAQRKALDALLVTPPAGGRGTRAVPLTELRQPSGRPTPVTFLHLVARLQRIRALRLDPTVVRQVHQNRLLSLAREGARSSPYFLQRFAPERRYATLVAFLLEASASLTDQALDLHDRLMGQFHATSRQVYAEQFQQGGKALNEKVRLYAAVGKALITAKEQAGDPFDAIQAVLSWERFVATVAEAEHLAQPPTFAPLALLDGSYGQLRRYAPTLLDAFAFAGAPASHALLEALALLQRLNAGGRKHVPREAPTAFVLPRWEPHVFTDTGIDRPFYELCTLSELRDRLRAGDVWVAGSRQYQAFDDYLLPAAAWQDLRRAGSLPVAVEADAASYLDRRRQEVHDELTTVGGLLAADRLPDVRFKGDRLVITPLVTAVPP